MGEINNFKNLYYTRLCGRWCKCDLLADVNHLHVKRIHLVSFIYIVIEDSSSGTQQRNSK
jgi:hypothetical protein